MPEQTHKLVHVPDVGVVAFPGDLEDAHVTNAIKLFRAQNKMASQPKMDPRLADVEKQFPRLSPYLKNVQIQQGQKASPTDDRGLEFYPPWESQNPNPGKITLELYDKMQGPALTSALGGDLLHYLGGIEPKTQKPVDPQYYAMKQAVLKARTPQQDALDKRIYADAAKTQGEKRPYDQWLQQSRVDAYIRGYVTPELGGKYPDEWRKNGFYKDPNMLKAVQAIQKYVTSAAAKPASLFAGKTTEASEHARQLRPAQPLSTAIPKLPEWATTPIATDADLDETPKGKAITAASQKAFEIAHPKIEAALEKGNNPVVLGGLKGATEFTKGMATPANLATLLALPESKLLSAFFTVQSLKGSYQDANAARKAYEAGSNEEAMSYATKALLGAGMGVAAGAHAYKGLPEGVRTRLASEDGSVGPQEGGAERRANADLRKRIDEMTPEEMRKILKTSDVVDLPNKRSFQEDQHFTPMPFVARSDADGLKAFNDKFGYDKGDELLRAKAEALKESGLNAYHEKGDEFLYRGKSLQDLNDRLEKAREIFRNKVFDVTLEDGRHVQLKGVDFSYGTGKDLKEAESKQHAHKQSREDAGLRKRGDISGLTEVQGQNPQNPSPAPSSAAASLAKVDAETQKDTSEALSKFLFGVGKRLAMESKGQGILDDMEESGESPRAVSDKFWDEIYPRLPAEIQRRFETYAKSISGFKPGSVVAVGPSGVNIVAKDWKEVGKALDLPTEAQYLEGTDRGLVVYMKEAERRFPANPALPEPKSSPLDEVKRQAQELQKKFREAGLSQ